VITLGLVSIVAAFLLLHKQRSSVPAPSATPAQVPGPAANIIILRVHGSNTIGAQLMPSLAEKYLKEQGATDVRRIPGKIDETVVQGVLPGDSSPKSIEIEAHGSATAFTDLAQSKCDVGMASRKIKPEEAAALSGLGDMTSPASEHVLGLDGIAVIVSPANPIQSLTKDQLSSIFSGAVTNWNQMLVPRRAIHVYARDSKSGTYDTFKTLVLGTGNLVSSAIRIEDSRELSDKVASDPDAIGFIGLPYIRSAKAIAISDSGSKPLLPTRLTVSTEDYALSRRLYLYTPANPSNQLTVGFVSFALSKSGQDSVAENGFVAQNVTAESIATASDAPSEYKRITRGADRLSLDFRFRTGSAGLDNKALADLDRVVTFLTDLQYPGRNVMLIGFADSTGTNAINVALSKSRAKAVADQFAPRGLDVGLSTGFGSALPVASNVTEDGRQKNRRVEIWLKK
jgi:phosphate transport system substrate-binding protein